MVGNADVEVDNGGWDFGNCGSVGVGKVDVEDMGVATASSSAAVELPELTVRVNSRLLQSAFGTSTSSASSTDAWRLTPSGACSGSAVRARLIGSAVSSERGRL